MLQHSTKNTLKGISPISNRKMFICYFQPSFLYGTDTLRVNKCDMERLERAYRAVFKHMLAVHDNTPSCSIYLVAGVFPAEAQRDLDIMGLLGQIAACPSDLQNVTDIIHHNLLFYGDEFGGWSGLTRETAAKYSLPDPAQYMEHPWRTDRWRAYCRDTIANHWDTKLKEQAELKSSLRFLDTDLLSIMKPAKIWSMAGLDSEEAKKTAVLNWMILGVYKTREALNKMKIIKSDLCAACSMNVPGSLPHYILYCPFVEDIRQLFFPMFLLNNPSLASLMDDETSIIISILDPESSLLPAEVQYKWQSSSKAYALSCQHLAARLSGYTCL